MTKKQFDEKIDDLIGTFASILKTESNSLFNSGMIDAEKYEDNFVLPRIIFTAAVERQKNCLKPLYKNSQK